MTGTSYWGWKSEANPSFPKSRVFMQCPRQGNCHPLFLLPRVMSEQHCLHSQGRQVKIIHPQTEDRQEPIPNKRRNVVILGQGGFLNLNKSTVEGICMYS